MVDIQHKNITGADAAHPPFYASESDPTTTLGAYRGWIKPSTGAVKVRNAANTAWIEIGGSSAGGSSDAAFGPVRLASTANVNIASPGSLFDGATVTGGDPNKRLLLKDQSSLAENGIYDWNGAAVPLTRVADASSADQFIQGKLVAVYDGDTHLREIWQLITNVATLETDTIQFQKAEASVAQLFDVLLGNTSALTDGDVLTWNDADNVWENAPGGAGVGMAVEEDGSEEGTGIDRFDFTTGLNLSVTGTQATVSGSDATETAKGIVELATNAETTTGSDTARATHPAGVAAAIAAHTGDTTDAHDASAISVLDTAAQYAAANVEDALAEVLDEVQAHEADTTDAHDATAISFTPAGSIASTNVQAAIEEAASEAGGGGSSANDTRVILGSDVATSSTTGADVTGLSFAVTSGIMYTFNARIAYTTSATTNGSAWGINASASPTFLAWHERFVGTTSASQTFAYFTALGLGSTSTASPGTSGIVEILGFIKPSTSGTFIIRFLSEGGAATITALAGSFVDYAAVA